MIRRRLLLTLAATLLTVASGCYHLSYNQATYHVDQGDFITAADKDLEALEAARDSVEARELWERIWPGFRTQMVAACEAQASQADPQALWQSLHRFETGLQRARQLQLPLPDLPAAALQQWHALGASRAYALGEGAEAGRQSREAARWFTLASRFQPGYRDAADRSERHRREAFVLVRLPGWQGSVSGSGGVDPYRTASQLRQTFLRGLQPLAGDFLGIQDGQEAPGWIGRPYRLTGGVTLSTLEPINRQEPGQTQGTATTVLLHYTRHHVRRQVTANLHVQLVRETDNQIVWSRSHSETAAAENRWLQMRQGPAYALPASLKAEFSPSPSPPAWADLEKQATDKVTQYLLTLTRSAVADLR